MKKIILILICIAGYSYTLDQTIINHWKDTMKYGIASQRSGVIKAIEDAKAAEAYNLIEEAMIKDINPDVRGNAVFSMVNLKIKDENMWIPALNSETNTDVLRKIVFAISELNIKNSGKRLLSLLTNYIDDAKEKELTSAILRALGEVAYKEASIEILGILTNIGYDNEIRSAAAISIGDLGNEDAISILSNILENTGESTEVRMFCALSIGKTGSIKAINILTPHIENEKEELNIRLYSIAGISYVKDKGVLQKMIEFMESENPKIRLEAIKAIGRSPDNKEAVDILKFKAVYDPDTDVQKEAKKTLQTLGINIDKK